MAPLQLVWFRNDLRCRDQAALAGAAAAGPVVAVYCFCPGQLAAHGVGGNRVAFLLRCLAALRDELTALGIPLKSIVCDDFSDVPDRLLALARELGVRRLWFNDEYPLNEQRRDRNVERAFGAADIDVRRCSDTLIRSPGTVLSREGRPYGVFSPFRRRWLEGLTPADIGAGTLPRRRPSPPVRSDPLPVMPRGFAPSAPAELWPGGERAALDRLDRFVSERLPDYARTRDHPALDGTSALSPWLAVGALSARQCLRMAVEANDGRLDGGDAGPAAWIDELIWREFYRHVVVAYPHVCRGRSFRSTHDALPWRDDPEALDAWKSGRTGFPFVDAGMRQLKATGWMHNRLRMITAMFLCKHLLIDWRKGESHFMELLVDGDFASNNGGWQWSASCGTDAVPYFRIFNPVTQSRRFDPEGTFITRHVPELKGLSGRLVHEPWKARGATLEYPRPIVDLAAARSRALGAFRALARP